MSLIVIRVLIKKKSQNKYKIHHNLEDNSTTFDQRFNYTINHDNLENTLEMDSHALKSISNEIEFDEVAQEHEMNETPSRASQRVNMSEKYESENKLFKVDRDSSKYYSHDGNSNHDSYSSSKKKGIKAQIQMPHISNSRVKKGEIMSGK